MLSVSVELMSGKDRAGWDKDFIEEEIRHLLRSMDVETLRLIVGHLEPFFDGKRSLVPPDTFSLILASLVTYEGATNVSDFFIASYNSLRHQLKAVADH